MFRLQALVLALGVMPAVAGAAHATGVPLPLEKPAWIAAKEKPAVPIPRPKPARAAGAESSPSFPRPATVGTWPADAVAAARAECQELLKGLDIRFTPRPAIGGPDGCGAAAPLEVNSIAGVELTPPALLNCRMARHLHQWINLSVQPAALVKLKTRVTTINTASSYVCRRRNGLKGGKLSEHARANALDMSGFKFAKSDAVTVDDGWGGILQSIGLSRGSSFLGAIRADACGHFTTVLGPGSDPHHGGHFHVDAIRRKNGGRICK